MQALSQLSYTPEYRHHLMIRGVIRKASFAVRRYTKLGLESALAGCPISVSALFCFASLAKKRDYAQLSGPVQVGVKKN
ncbi:hypothetical protein [Bordetella genomosp. 1]|uniref:hypothetical protein n=1 Tax=Bordetella genomosp. 1 TaxID=1395607 RepID=UPI001140CF68|nr:hypothetical protein [Bordetella genomosp. 1]